MKHSYSQGWHNTVLYLQTRHTEVHREKYTAKARQTSIQTSTLSQQLSTIPQTSAKCTHYSHLHRSQLNFAFFVFGGSGTQQKWYQ